MFDIMLTRNIRQTLDDFRRSVGLSIAFSRIRFFAGDHSEHVFCSSRGVCVYRGRGRADVACHSARRADYARRCRGE